MGAQDDASREKELLAAVLEDDLINLRTILSKKTVINLDRNEWKMCEDPLHVEALKRQGQGWDCLGLGQGERTPGHCGDSGGTCR